MSIFLLISVILFVFIIFMTFYHRKQTKIVELEMEKTSKVVALSDEAFQEIIKTGVTLVDFWAPWCGPCQRQKPIIYQIAEEYYEQANVCTINVDEHKKAAIQMKIKNIPNIIIFRDGEAVKQIIGAKQKQQIVNALTSVIEQRKSRK